MDLRGRGDVQVLTKGRFDVSPSYAPNGADDHLCEPRSRPRRAGAGQRRRASAGDAWCRARAKCKSRPGRRSDARRQSKCTNALIVGTLEASGSRRILMEKFNEKNAIDRAVCSPPRRCSRAVPRRPRPSSRRARARRFRAPSSAAGEGASTSTTPLGGDGGADGRRMAQRGRRRAGAQASSISISTSPTSSRSSPTS